MEGVVNAGLVMVLDVIVYLGIELLDDLLLGFGELGGEAHGGLILGELTDGLFYRETRCSASLRLGFDVDDVVDVGGVAGG